jgi:hypothetical protein
MFLRASTCVAFVGFLSSASLAHHPGVGGNEYAGPIYTISADTLERGHSAVSIVYEFIKMRALSDATMAAAVTPETHVHSLKTIASAAASFAYGLTDNATVTLRLPWVKRTGIREAHQHDPNDPVEFHQLGDASGVGDLSAILQYRFLNDRARGTQAALLLGVKAPTGRTNSRTEDGDLFDTEFQPGSGSWDAIFGGAVSQQTGGPLSFHANVLYVLAGNGSQNTDLGDRFLYNAAIVYRVFGSNEPSVRVLAHSHPRGHAGHAHPPAFKTIPVRSGPALDAVLELNGEWQAKTTTNGVSDPNSGGNLVYVSPGLRLSVDKWSGHVSAGFPILDDPNGTQPKPGWRILVGASLGF